MRRSCLRTLLIVLPLLLAAAEAAAQRTTSAEVESKTLKTKDGVELNITYYASSVGKDATPVILLHDLKGTGRDFARLARRLQQPEEDDKHESFAVVTVDLRGHGDSRKQTNRGRTRELDSAKLSVQDMRGMVLGDMEAVRKFLVTENDAGKLNLNRLSIVGAGLGAIVAVNFAANDWAAPQLATIKQGQDVKALVLVSPEWKIKGLSMQNALKQYGVQREVAMMMPFGNEKRNISRNVERVYGQLDRYHSDARQITSKELASVLEELPGLLSLGFNTELQGAELFKRAGKRADGLVALFLQQHTVSDEYSYSVRRQK